MSANIVIWKKKNNIWHFSLDNTFSKKMIDVIDFRFKKLNKIYLIERLQKNGKWKCINICRKRIIAKMMTIDEFSKNQKIILE